MAAGARRLSDAIEPAEEGGEKKPSSPRTPRSSRSRGSGSGEGGESARPPWWKKLSSSTWLPSKGSGGETAAAAAGGSDLSSELRGAEQTSALERARERRRAASTERFPGKTKTAAEKALEEEAAAKAQGKIPSNTAAEEEAGKARLREQ